MTPNVPQPAPPGKSASPSRRKASDWISVKGARWLGWGVLAGVAPFIIEALFMSVSKTFSVAKILGRGDLMLVGAAIGFSAVAELIANNKVNAKPKVFWSAFCVICSFVEAGVYGAIKGSGITGDATFVSLVLFLTSLITGYACISLSE